MNSDAENRHDLTEKPEKVAEQELRGLARLIRATRVSLQGLSWGIRNEEAIRLEVVMLIVFIPVGIWLGQTGVERALLVLPLLFAFIVELLNTAVEATIDRIGYEHHELSGLAKDLGSSAVMVALIAIVVAWGLVLWDRVQS